MSEHGADKPETVPTSGWRSPLPEAFMDARSLKVALHRYRVKIARAEESSASSVSLGNPAMALVRQLRGSLACRND